LSYGGLLAAAIIPRQGHLANLPLSVRHKAMRRQMQKRHQEAFHRPAPKPPG